MWEDPPRSFGGPDDDMSNESQPGYDLDDRIVALVQEFWRDHNRPLLLSQLGGQDNGEIGKRAKEMAGGLGTYLRLRLPDRLRVIQHSTRPTVIGAIPVGDDMPDGNFDALLNQTQTQSDNTTLRFHPAFWAAFRKPLDHSMRRYMSTQPPLHFRDEPVEIQSSSFIEIERKYIADPGADVKTVEQIISSWLGEHDIDAAAFGSDRRMTTARLPSDDLLGRLLLALEPGELQRMSIPLDIVRKLRNQSL